MRAPAHPRRIAPYSPTPGGSRLPPTARRPWLAWLLLQHWTTPRPRCLVLSQIRWIMKGGLMLYPQHRLHLLRLAVVVVLIGCISTGTQAINHPALPPLQWESGPFSHLPLGGAGDLAAY